jgi:hydrogenase-4 component F
MSIDEIMWVILVLPFVAGTGALFVRSARGALALVCASVAASTILAFVAAREVFAYGPIETAGNWLYLDALSAYHLVVLMIVFGMSSLYAWSYFGAEIRDGHFGRRQARRFAALWLGSLGAMTLVLVSNNLGIIWVGIEATTLLTAFLICVHVTPSSLEAMWKYLIMCSVGVAFAFIGTLLVGVSAAKLHLAPADALLWKRLSESAPLLDPALVKAGFIFLLVGYGTKVGLAPLHSWLPDAHSQAPAPVSAVFSGFLLNTALYCIMRYLPIVEGSPGNAGWGIGLLLVFGLVSISVAAAFIVFQHDGKRLLAYHSVEHMGIIALGLGLGGFGTFAGLFHTLNHSLCKALSFFSMGRLGQIYGTHDMRKMSGALRAAPVWGIGLFASLLALIGVAPFALFMSEFQILKAAADNKSYWAMGLFLLGTGVVFVGALRHAISMAWGEGEIKPQTQSATLIEKGLVFLPLAALLLLGLWMPGGLRHALTQAALVLGGGR